MLLREALHVDLPAYTEVRLESAELNSALPTEYRADLVVLLVEGKRVLGIIVEVQLSSDDDKRFAWPVYVVSDTQRQQILGCTDLDTIKRWVRRAVTTRSLEELFDPQSRKAMLAEC